MPVVPQFTLTYFNGMGRAEASRLMFAYAGVKYTDKRVDKEEWATIKPSTPMGQLPLLEMDGKLLCQSQAISRFLAGMFGLRGKDDFESARCDMLIGGLEDVFTAVKPWFMEQDPEKKKEMMAEIMESTIKPAHERFEKFLTDNGTGYFVGDKLTWADIVLFHHFTTFGQKFGNLDAHPKLVEFTKKIGDIPSIKEWIEKRPKTEF